MALQGLLPGPAEMAVFAMAVLVLNATPGVDFVLTVSRTLQGGARAGMAAALGINAGCVVHALAAAFGLAALLVVVPAAFRVVQWCGAAYLVWLGVNLLLQAWRSDGLGRQGDVRSGSITRSFAADFRAGLLTNVLNPKVALFFLAFLPQFVPVASAHKTLSFLLLSAWMLLQSVLFLIVVVVLASRLSGLGRSPVVARALHAVGGLLFVALALRLLKERPALS